MAEYKLQYTATEINERLRKIDDINDKVNKVDGKGLSTNDFTDEYMAKLESAFSYSVNHTALPTVTSSDSGKILCVSDDGEWVAKSVQFVSGGVENNQLDELSSLLEGV